MEILLWLLPAVVMTVAAMLWVSWLGRDGRGEVDAAESAEKLRRALMRQHVRRYGAPPPPPREGESSITLRPALEQTPEDTPGDTREASPESNPDDTPEQTPPPAEQPPGGAPAHERTRRAS